MPTTPAPFNPSYNPFAMFKAPAAVSTYFQRMPSPSGASGGSLSSAIRSAVGSDRGMRGVSMRGLGDELGDTAGDVLKQVFGSATGKLDELDWALKLIIGLAGVAAATGVYNAMKRR